MNIKTIPVGELQANCYLLERNDEIIIIDPGDEAEKIEAEINGKKVIGILLTHSHFDHIGALSYFEKKYKLIHNKIDDTNIEIIPTPGHSKDSLTFYFPKEKIMFTGDFLFKETIGRMDLPTGDKSDMKQSLEKINKYPNDIIIYPGHGASSVLGKEKEYFNYYL